jgi:hypothetical protein
MQLTPRQSDLALGTLSLAVIAALGAFIAFDSLRSTDTLAPLAAPAISSQDAAETPGARGNRSEYRMQTATLRPIAEDTPRRGDRAKPVATAFAHSREIVDPEPTRSRH